jgi:hypothetical protein
MSDYRDDMRHGAFVTGEDDVLRMDAYVSRTYRPDHAELASLAPSELIERIHGIAASHRMYMAAGGPAWAITFCMDAQAAAERELASRVKETP